jgi:hypothetical protein
MLTKDKAYIADWINNSKKLAVIFNEQKTYKKFE